MAIVPSTEYPGQVAVDAAYPQGKARNRLTPGDGTGTPLEELWVNDLWGFLQALLLAAGATPSGVPDTADVSQYLDAIQKLYGYEVQVYTTPGTVTWTKPTWATATTPVRYDIVGGGGGGGGGGESTGTGGGGGGSGARVHGLIMCGDLGATVPVTVGDRGAGGAGGSGGPPGASTDGGASTFGASGSYGDTFVARAIGGAAGKAHGLDGTSDGGLGYCGGGAGGDNSAGGQAGARGGHLIVSAGTGAGPSATGGTGGAGAFGSASALAWTGAMYAPGRFVNPMPATSTGSGSGVGGAAGTNCGGGGGGGAGHRVISEFGGSGLIGGGAGGAGGRGGGGYGAGGGGGGGGALSEDGGEGGDGAHGYVIVITGG
jgi:hypothetical protein